MKLRRSLPAALVTLLAGAVSGPVLADVADAAPTTIVATDASPRTFTNTIVTLTGNPVYGGTLTADLGSWTPQPTDVEYVWLVNGVPSDLFSGPTLRVSDDVYADQSQIQVMVTSAHAEGVTDLDSPVTSAPVTLHPASFTGVRLLLHGSAKPGSTLTADAGSWNPSPAELTYSWSGISGSPSDDGTSYTVLPEDVGHKITVRANGWADFYADATASATATVTANAFRAVPAPQITGSAKAKVGSPLKVNTGAWSPAATVGYQWKANGVAIKGATHSTYSPAAAYRGKKLTVTVTAKRSGYTTLTRSSSGKTVGYGVLAPATPKITGTTAVGKTLKASLGTWKPKPSLSVQWKRNGTKIKGATHTTYKVTASDRAKKITVTVTGKKSAYTTKSVTSGAVTVTVPFTKTFAPTITGTTRVSSTLTAHTKAWSPKAALSYQWKRDGKAIAGATRSTYKLAGADYHHRITVTVSGKKSGYATATRTSSRTASVAAPKPTLTKDGMYRVGSSIKAGTYVSSGGTDLCYWERDTASQKIIANDIGGGQRMVTILASDKYFETDGCGTWTKYVALGAPRTTIPSEGVFGKGQIKPGTYVSAGPTDDMCYWSRLSALTGDLDGIIDNGIETGRVYVTIKAGDAGFETSGCRTWKRSGS